MTTDTYFARKERLNETPLGSIAHCRARRTGGAGYGRAQCSRSATVERYRSFQLALGFRPDPRHPLELFSVDDCRHAVIGATVPGGPSDAPLPEASGLSPDDAREILHALLTPHRVVVGEQLVDGLRTAARRHLSDLRTPTMVNRSDPR